MEALYDQQQQILEDKLKSMQPLKQKLENNVVASDSAGVSVDVEVGASNGVSPKRQHQFEKFVVDKKFRFDDDDDGDDNKWKPTQLYLVEVSLIPSSAV